jgi:tRNA G26 N,N-dimethylase Trm1
MVMNLNSQATPVTLKTPDGTLEIDALPLGRMIYQPRSERTLEILSAQGLGSVRFTAKAEQPKVLVNDATVPNENLRKDNSGTWVFVSH